MSKEIKQMKDAQLNRALFIKEIQFVFPCMPKEDFDQIMKNYDDRSNIVSHKKIMSRASKTVIAYIRHNYTAYDNTRKGEFEHSFCRAIISEKVDKIYNKWRGPKKRLLTAQNREKMIRQIIAQQEQSNEGGLTLK